MIKVSLFIVRRSDLTRDQFLDYWTNKHCALARSLPEARFVPRYVQQYAIEHPPEGASMATFDGVAEAWFDSMETLMASVTSEDYQSIIAEDEKNFLDRSKTRMMITTERDDLWPVDP